MACLQGEDLGNGGQQKLFGEMESRMCIAQSSLGTIFVISSVLVLTYGRSCDSGFMIQGSLFCREVHASQREGLGL